MRERSSTLTPLARHLDAERLEPEPLDVGAPARADQQLLGGPARRRAVLGPVHHLEAVLDRDPLRVGAHVRTSTPSPRRRATSRSTSSGSSRGSTRSPRCSTSRVVPRRRNACESSIAIGPPPITTSDAGARSISHSVSLVRKPASASPSIGGSSRPRARAEQDVLGLELLRAHAHRVRARDRRGIPDRAARGPSRGSAPGRRRWRRSIAARRARARTPSRCRSAARRARSRTRPRSACGGRPGRGEQRLGRHAAGPQAVAADAVALDDGDLEVERRGELGGHHAARAHADDDQVVAHPSAPDPIRTRPRPTTPRMGVGRDVN